jgi:organic radical activating enzyme
LKGYQQLNDQTNGLLVEGKVLPLMEAFYTLQGEGFHSGLPSYFVRIGGCDVGCHWCDVKESWNALLHPPTHTDAILEQIMSCQAKTVVVTGGEPMNYNLNYFTQQLQNAGFETHLETSGSSPLSGNWNWICLSPKRNKAPLQVFYDQASELKVIIENEADFEWAEQNANKVNSNCQLFLQPEWSKSKLMMQKIVDYALQNPRWKVSIQSHKYMHIP